MRQRILATILALAFAFFIPAIAPAQLVWERDDSLTTESFTLADGVGVEFDLATALSMSASQLTAARQGRSVILAITVVPNPLFTGTAVTGTVTLSDASRTGTVSIAAGTTTGTVVLANANGTGTVSEADTTTGTFTLDPGGTTGTVVTSVGTQTATFTLTSGAITGATANTWPVNIRSGYVRFRFDATTGTPATRLAGTSPATSGVVVREGETVYTIAQGAYLSVIGDGATTSNVKIARVR